MFDLSGAGLDKKDLIGSSDPFVSVFRAAVGGGGWDLVHKTKVIKNNLHPKWGRVKLPLGALCNGDFNRPNCSRQSDVARQWLQRLASRFICNNNDCDGIGSWVR